MALHPSIPEEYRIRVAVVVFLLGLSLIALGIVLVVSRGAEYPPDLPPGEIPVSTTTGLKQFWDGMKQVLFYTSIVLLAFFTATFAFLRWSKRFRANLLRKPLTPTPTDDIWAKYRLSDQESDKAKE